MKYQSIFILSNSSIILLDERDAKEDAASSQSERKRVREKAIIQEMPSHPCRRVRTQFREAMLVQPEMRHKILAKIPMRSSRNSSSGGGGAGNGPASNNMYCRYVEHVVVFRFSVTEAAFFSSLIQYIVSFGFIATMFRWQLG